MQRLRALLTADDGEVGVALCFNRNQSGLANITGRINCVVSLTCQRCMQALQLPIDAKVSLGIVHNQSQIEQLPDSYEPLIVEEDYTSLTELVEDELLLALPVAPVHDVDQCPEGSRFIRGERVSNEDNNLSDAHSAKGQVSERPNPFAVLADLKAGLKKK
jgi:uncharacterized protein